MKDIFDFGGILIKLLYSLSGNLGVSFMLAAVIARIISLPLTLIQVKNHTIFRIIFPSIVKIGKKYPISNTNTNGKLDATTKENQKARTGAVGELFKSFKYYPYAGISQILLHLLLLALFYGAASYPLKYLPNATDQILTERFLWISNVTLPAYTLINGFGINVYSKILAIVQPLLVIGSSYLLLRQNEVVNPFIQNRPDLMLPFVLGIAGLMLSPALSIYWTTQALLGVVELAVFAVYADIKVANHLMRIRNRK